MEPNIGEKPHFGGHLLIILSEPYTDNHRERILEKVSKGFFSWDVNRVGCDLTCLKDVFNSDSSSEQTEGFLIQYSTEALAVEVLLNPKVNILKRCIKNVLSSVTAHKHIIHAGYTFTESGSWILQDGVFSFQDFTDAFNDHGVQQVLTKIPESSVHVHCIAEGDWSEKNIAGITACVYLNPPEIMSSFPDCHDLLEYLKPFLISQPLEEIMKASDVVGNIRFSRPTLYIFPGGDGNCALFGIRGFNILIDGGFERKPSFWEFVRHIDTLDAMMVTRLNETNLNGITSLIKRKQKEQIFPNIRYVFCNIMDEPQLSSGEFPKVKEDLLISVFDEIYELLNNLNKLNLKPHPCYRENGTCPLTLYHKMGHGTLDMHVLHPLKHTKGVKEFFEQWSSKKDSFTDTSHGEIPVPLSDLASICVLLVWRPANSKDSVTRILVTGNTPQTQIFEGLDKMQNLKILHNVDCSQTVLQKTVVDKSKHTKNVEKPVAKAPSKPNVSSSFAQQKKIAQKTHVAIGKKDGINMSKAMPEKSPICTDKVSAKKNTESKKLDTKFNGKTLEGKGDTLEKTGRPFNKVEIARRSDVSVKISSNTEGKNKGTIDGSTNKTIEKTNVSRNANIETNMKKTKMTTKLSRLSKEITGKSPTTSPKHLKKTPVSTTKQLDVNTENQKSDKITSDEEEGVKQDVSNLVDLTGLKAGSLDTEMDQDDLTVPSTFENITLNNTSFEKTDKFNAEDQGLAKIEIKLSEKAQELVRDEYTSNRNQDISKTGILANHQNQNLTQIEIALRKNEQGLIKTENVFYDEDQMLEEVKSGFDDNAYELAQSKNVVNDKDQNLSQTKSDFIEKDQGLTQADFLFNNRDQIQTTHVSYDKDKQLTQIDYVSNDNDHELAPIKKVFNYKEQELAQTESEMKINYQTLVHTDSISNQELTHDKSAFTESDYAFVQTESVAHDKEHNLIEPGSSFKEKNIGLTQSKSVYNDKDQEMVQKKDAINDKDQGLAQTKNAFSENDQELARIKSILNDKNQVFTETETLLNDHYQDLAETDNVFYGKELKQVESILYDKDQGINAFNDEYQILPETESLGIESDQGLTQAESMITDKHQVLAQAENTAYEKKQELKQSESENDKNLLQIGFFLNNKDQKLTQSEDEFNDKDQGVIQSEEVFSHKDQALTQTDCVFNDKDQGLTQSERVFNDTDKGLTKSKGTFEDKDQGLTQGEYVFNNKDQGLTHDEYVFNDKDQGLTHDKYIFNDKDQGLTQSGVFNDKDQGLTHDEYVFNDKDQRLTHDEYVFNDKDQGLTQSGVFNDKDQGLTQGKDVFNDKDQGMAQSESVFNNTDQELTQSEGAFNYKGQGLAQSENVFNDKGQALTHSEGAFNEKNQGLTKEGVFNDKDQGLTQSEGAFDDKDQGLTQSEDAFNVKGQGLAQSEDVFNDKNQELIESESVYNDKVQGLTQSEGVFNDKDQGLTLSEAAFNDKHQGLTQGEGAFNDKDQRLTQSEGIVNDKDQGMTQGEDVFEDKDQGLTKSEGAFNDKDRALTHSEGAFNDKDQGLTQSEGAFHDTDQGLTQGEDVFNDKNQELEESESAFNYINQGLTQSEGAFNDKDQGLTQGEDVFHDKDQGLTQSEGVFNDKHQGLIQSETVFNDNDQELPQSEGANIDKGQGMTQSGDEFCDKDQVLTQSEVAFSDKDQSLTQGEDVSNDKDQGMVQSESVFNDTDQELTQSEGAFDYKGQELAQSESVFNDEDQALTHSEGAFNEKNHSLTKEGVCNDKDQALTQSEYVFNDKDQGLTQSANEFCDQVLTQSEVAFSDKDQALTQGEYVFNDKDQGLAQSEGVFNDKDQGLTNEGGFNDKDQGLTQSEGVFNDKDQGLAQSEGVFIGNDQGLTQSEGVFNNKDQVLTQSEVVFSDKDQALTQSEGAFNDKDQGLTQSEGAFHDTDQGLTQGEDVFNDKNQELEESESAFNNINQGLTQSEGAFNDKDQGLTQGEDVLNGKDQGLAQNEGVFNNKDQGLTQSEDVLNGKDQGLAPNEGVFNNKGQGLTQSEDVLNGKDQGLAPNEDIFIDKDQELTQSEGVFNGNDQGLTQSEGVFNNKDQVLTQSEVVFSDKDQALTQSEGVFNGKDQRMANSESVFNDKYQGLTQSADVLNDQNQELEESESAFNYKGQGLTQSEGAFNDKDQELTQSEGVFNGNDQGLAQIESVFNDKDKKLEESESAFNDNDQGLTQGEGAFNDKDQALTQSEGAFNDKVQGLTNEGVFNDKDQELTQSEGAFNDKDQGLAQSKGVFNDKDQGLTQNISEADDNDQGPTRSESAFNEKDHGLVQMESTAYDNDREILPFKKLFNNRDQDLDHTESLSCNDQQLRQVETVVIDKDPRLFQIENALHDKDHELIIIENVSNENIQELVHTEIELFVNKQEFAETEIVLHEIDQEVTQIKSSFCDKELKQEGSACRDQNLRLFHPENTVHEKIQDLSEIQNVTIENDREFSHVENVLYANDQELKHDESIPHENDRRSIHTENLLLNKDQRIQKADKVMYVTDEGLAQTENVSCNKEQWVTQDHGVYSDNEKKLDQTKKELFDKERVFVQAGIVLNEKCQEFIQAEKATYDKDTTLVQAGNIPYNNGRSFIQTESTSDDKNQTLPTAQYHELIQSLNENGQKLCQAGLSHEEKLELAQTERTYMFNDRDYGLSEAESVFHENDQVIPKSENTHLSSDKDQRLLPKENILTYNENKVVEKENLIIDKDFEFVASEEYSGRTFSHKDQGLLQTESVLNDKVLDKGDMVDEGKLNDTEQMVAETENINNDSLERFAYTESLSSIKVVHSEKEFNDKDQGLVHAENVLSDTDVLMQISGNIEYTLNATSTKSHHTPQTTSKGVLALKNLHDDDEQNFGIPHLEPLRAHTELSLISEDFGRYKIKKLEEDHVLDKLASIQVNEQKLQNLHDYDEHGLEMSTNREPVFDELDQMTDQQVQKPCTEVKCLLNKVASYTIRNTNKCFNENLDAEVLFENKMDGAKKLEKVVNMDTVDKCPSNQGDICGYQPEQEGLPAEVLKTTETIEKNVSDTELSGKKIKEIEEHEKVFTGKQRKHHTEVITQVIARAANDDNFDVNGQERQQSHEKEKMLEFNATRHLFSHEKSLKEKDKQLTPSLGDFKYTYDENAKEKLTNQTFNHQTNNEFDVDFYKTGTVALENTDNQFLSLVVNDENIIRNEAGKISYLESQEKQERPDDLKHHEKIVHKNELGEEKTQELPEDNIHLSGSHPGIKSEPHTSEKDYSTSETLDAVSDDILPEDGTPCGETEKFISHCFGEGLPDNFQETKEVDTAPFENDLVPLYSTNENEVYFPEHYLCKGENIIQDLKHQIYDEEEQDEIRCSTTLDGQNSYDMRPSTGSEGENGESDIHILDPNITIQSSSLCEELIAQCAKQKYDYEKSKSPFVEEVAYESTSKAYYSELMGKLSESTILSVPNFSQDFQQQVSNNTQTDYSDFQENHFESFKDSRNTDTETKKYIQTTSCQLPNSGQCDTEHTPINSNLQSCIYSKDISHRTNLDRQTVDLRGAHSNEENIKVDFPEEGCVYKQNEGFFSLSYSENNCDESKTEEENLQINSTDMIQQDLSMDNNYLSVNSLKEFPASVSEELIVNSIQSSYSSEESSKGWDKAGDSNMIKNLNAEVCEQTSKGQVDLAYLSNMYSSNTYSWKSDNIPDDHMFSSLSVPQDQTNKGDLQVKGNESVCPMRRKDSFSSTCLSEGDGSACDGRQATDYINSKSFHPEDELGTVNLDDEHHFVINQRQSDFNNISKSLVRDIPSSEQEFLRDETVTTIHTQSSPFDKRDEDFQLDDWDKPMGLPTPPDSQDISNRSKTASKTDTKDPSKTPSKTASNHSVSKGLLNGKSASKATKKSVSSRSVKKTSAGKCKNLVSNDQAAPIYVDLTYVPNHGDPNYCDVEFFRRIRARYYVFSGTNPSKTAFDALLEAKKDWEDKDAVVTIIPTYETDTLGYWIALNQDILMANKIEVSPSVNRCTINLQDHETSCSAYRLEF